MSEKPYFRTTFCNQRVNGSETLLKSARHYYYPIIPWIWDKYSSKRSVLDRSEILLLFVNALTAEYKYTCRDTQTLPQQILTSLSLKQKTYSGFFIAFLKSTWNLEYPPKKGESSSWSISKINDSEKSGYLNV